MKDSPRIEGAHLPEMYCRAAEVFGQMPAFASRHEDGRWVPTSYRELWERGCHLAAALMDWGVQRGDRVGLFADNRLEWILADYAVQIAGAADVPRGLDVTTGELTYILEHAGIEVLFVENEKLLERLESALGDQPVRPRVILFEGTENPDHRIHTFAGMEKHGRGIFNDWQDRVEERWKGIQADDLFTLIYTSGTTGKPKGVMLTQGNMMSQIRNIPLELTWRDRGLSLLPVWHSFERVMEMVAISRGTCVYYSSVRHLKDDLLKVEPTLMASAPRLWESLHERIIKGVEKSHPVRRALFHTARWLSTHYHHSVDHLRDREFRSRPVQPVVRFLLKAIHLIRWVLLLPWYGFFNAAVLERLRQVAGGSLRATISGGGALPAEIDRFFNHLGIEVLEGYGLTETAPVLAVRVVENRVIGTVGPLIPETELRILDLETGKILYPDSSDRWGGRMKKGEIHVRGPQVMRGYYKDDEATGKVLKDGWLNTGDLGLVSWNDCLKVLGRSKETIVLSSGENLEPGPIEMKLRQSPLIENCMVVGQDKRFLGLLVYPDENACRDKLGGEPEETDLHKLLEGEVRQLISGENGFKPYERIRRLRLLPEPFVVGEEITALHKLRRHVITANHTELIESMYSEKSHEH